MFARSCSRATRRFSTVPNVTLESVASTIEPSMRVMESVLGSISELHNPAINELSLEASGARQLGEHTIFGPETAVLDSPFEVIKQVLSEPYTVIRPMFPDTDAVDRSLFTINCSQFDMKQLDNAVRSLMKQVYHEQGIVYLTDTNLTNLADMGNWARVLVGESMVEYTGGANPRIPLEKNVYDVGAPLPAWLHYHHEMAYVGRSVKNISLFCKHSCDNGGTFASDNIQATDAILATAFGQKLKDKNICYVRNLTDKEFYKGKDASMVYNHWQDSFDVEDPELVAPLAKERGLEVEWDIQGANRFLKTKYYVSAFEYFAQMDRNLLYSSVADDAMWFDSWPGIDVVPDDERPLKLTFGDDTMMTQQEKQLFVDIYDNYGFELKWNPGDIGVMCNYRYAHGRPGIVVPEGQKRELGVILGHTFEREGHREEKW